MSAVTGFKRLGLAICVLILGVFGALAVVSVLLPKDQVREAVKAEICAATGLDPILRGDVSVSLFPYGQVILSDVSLGDSQGEPPLHAARLTARLSFLPLLTGQIDVADLTISDPRILVTIDSEGRSNWSPLLKSLTRAFNPECRNDDTPTFSEIRINGGTVVVRDDYRKIYEYFSGADLSLAWPAISRASRLPATCAIAARSMEIGVTLGNFAAALQGERSALKVRIGSAPFKFAFDGAIATRSALKIEGAASADSASLRRALQWIGKKPLPGGGFERFSLKAQTNVVGGTIALSSVNLELDGNSAEGVLTFAADGRQTLQGTLAADEINLTPYVSAIRLITATDRDWSRAPLDLDGLMTADVDLRLSAGKITIGTTSFGRTAIATNLRNGNLGVTIGEARGFGGSLRGTIGLARSEQGAVFTSQMNFENVNLEKCIGDLFGVNRIDGKGNLAVTLEGTGNSVFSITRTLDGEVALTGTKGALTGLNVEQLLRRLERRPLSGGNEFRSGRTPFDSLSSTRKGRQGSGHHRGSNLAQRGRAARDCGRRFDPQPRARPERRRNAGLDPFQRPQILRASLRGAGPVGRSADVAGCADPDPALGCGSSAARRLARSQRTRSRAPCDGRAVSPARGCPPDCAARDGSSRARRCAARKRSRTSGGRCRPHTGSRRAGDYARTARQRPASGGIHFRQRRRAGPCTGRFFARAR